MARARNIKPGFFKNDVITEYDPYTRLLFIGLWCLADREGRLVDRPRRICVEIFPYEMHLDVHKMLDELHNGGFILRYEANGDNYIQIVNFVKHQNPHHKEVPSEIPAPNGHTDSGRGSHQITGDQRQRIYRRDGYQCLECGTKEKLSIDHIQPLSKGGSNDDSNLRTLCIKCNSIKGNRSIDQACLMLEPCLDEASQPDPADSPSPHTPSLQSETPIPPSQPETVDNVDNSVQVPKSGSFDKSKLGDCRFNIVHLLDDKGISAAKKEADGWDIYHLANIYNQNVNSGKMERPKMPNRAFPAWCAKYTKGKKP